MKVEDVARICHEANRALQIVQNDPTIPVSKSWDECGEEQQQSVINGVEGVLAGNSFEESHQNWCKFKLEHGWVVGPIKDETKKEHPLLIPYDELPQPQRLKDALFATIIYLLS